MLQLQEFLVCSALKRGADKVEEDAVQSSQRRVGRGRSASVARHDRPATIQSATCRRTQPGHASAAYN
eukprot:1159539-Pelagomonas_calceolata.AAC.2